MGTKHLSWRNQTLHWKTPEVSFIRHTAPTPSSRKKSNNSPSTRLGDVIVCKIYCPIKSGKTKESGEEIVYCNRRRLFPLTLKPNFWDSTRKKGGLLLLLPLCQLMSLLSSRRFIKRMAIELRSLKLKGL